METITLDDYMHEETILRFTDMFDVTMDEAKDIFHEMKNLFKLMDICGGEEYIFTHEPLWIIDEMWHTFILFSKDYREFCETYFNGMIDHNITIRKDKLNIIDGLENKDPEITETVSNAVRRLYELIYEHLGKETLVKWIDGFGKKYTIEYVNKIRKPIQ